MTLFSRADAFVVLGRHTQCGLVLSGDPRVALRHLLIRSTALPSGGAALRILDLHTDNGFVLPDGSRQTSIFAEGPVAVAVGEHALVALPGDGKEDGLPNVLPAMELETPQAVRDQLAALQQAMSPYRANARPSTCSRITLMPRLVMIGEPLPTSMGRLAGGGRWKITLEREGRCATLSVSEEELIGGIVIGRSERCHSEMLRRITDHNTSRVHVLVLREGETIHAYDLASTQGTFSEKGPIKRIPLADAGTRLTLGRGDRSVKMYWRRDGS
jgi:hypothetical protein